MDKFFLIIIIVILKVSFSQGVIDLQIENKILNNKELTFYSHRGDGPYDTTLAMSIQYQPVKLLRAELSKELEYNLNFFKLWNPEGEAHITIITPVEYFKNIKRYLSIERIEAIAQEMGVQSSEFEILGLGRGEAEVNQQLQETYFIIVQSPNLLKIRHQIYNEYLANGGPKEGWNPDDYYPHITIGFSLWDLHISDGVFKDVEHSLDKRFNLNIVNNLDTQGDLK